MSNRNCVKCDFTNRPIYSNDKNSVQILLADIDNNGRATGKNKIINISGQVRENGFSDRYLFESECLLEEDKKSI